MTAPKEYETAQGEAMHKALTAVQEVTERLSTGQPLNDGDESVLLAAMVSGALNALGSIATNLRRVADALESIDLQMCAVEDVVVDGQLPDHLAPAEGAYTEPGRRG